MLSSRTKLGLRLLNELEKSEDLKMTAADLKRRIGVGVRVREPEWVLQDLKNASLIGSEWKSNRRRYFAISDTMKASLLDLVVAVDGRFCLWAEFFKDFPYNLTSELMREAAVKTIVDPDISAILKRISLGELVYGKSHEDFREDVPPGYYSGAMVADIQI